jgi:probable HAF family extracellular repeat protein
MRSLGTSWILIAGCVLGAGPVSGSPSFQGLGDLAGGVFDSRALAISGDGTVVVGSSESSSGREAFRWSIAEGLSGLGDLAGGGFSSAALGVNLDGTVIVGTGSVAGTQPSSEAFRWTAATGMSSIGDLAGGITQATAFDVSADGTVVVGNGTSSSTGSVEPFRWTSGTGIQVLAPFPSGAGSGSALGISGDGSIVTGRLAYSTGAGVQGYRWTQSTGIVPLGDIAGDTPPPGTSFSAVSADGSTLVGESSGNGSVRWTQSGGFQLLGLGASTFANAVDADGSTIVGSLVLEDFTLQATIWTHEAGNRILADMLRDIGLDLTGWQLTSAQGISYDGLTIAGIGTNPSGMREGWIAVIPEPASVSLVALGLSVLAARRRSGTETARISRSR